MALIDFFCVDVTLNTSKVLNTIVLLFFLFSMYSLTNRSICVSLQNMLRAHDNEIDQLLKQHRQMQEKLSTAQLQECRAMQKKVKMDQVYFSI